MLDSDCRLVVVMAPVGGLTPLIQHFYYGYNAKLNELPSIIVARLSIPVNNIFENVA